MKKLLIIVLFLTISLIPRVSSAASDEQLLQFTKIMQFIALLKSSEKPQATPNPSPEPTPTTSINPEVIKLSEKEPSFGQPYCNKGTSNAPIIQVPNKSVFRVTISNKEGDILSKQVFKPSQKKEYTGLTYGTYFYDMEYMYKGVTKHSTGAIAVSICN